MTDDFNKEIYMDQCALFFNFLLRKRQWSGINQSDYMRWMNNFNDMEDGAYIGKRILNSLLYYSEDDLLHMLDDSIMNVFEKEAVLPLQIAKSFSALTSEMEYAIREAMSATIVIPAIGDIPDPGASGREVIRYVRNHFTPQLQTSFHDRILPSAKYDRILVVDDCVGSGNQFVDFWDLAEISGGLNLREWAKTNNIKLVFIALVGYKKTIEKLRSEYPEITILCAEYIDDQHRVFSEVSSCWKDSTEKLSVEKRLEEYASAYELPLKGHDDLDFAVALHKTIPDWSMPILYKNKNGWRHLIERKDTYV